MAFTVEKLVRELQITDEQATTIIGLLRGRIDPFTIPATDAWRRACYHEPDPKSPETRMHAINAVLEACGSEAIWGSSETRPVAEYCNTGDTYNATILYDYVAHKYRLTTMGDFVERYERRYGIRQGIRIV